MESHLPNFQYVLNHPDIHLCIIDQIKIIQTQSNPFRARTLTENRLKLLQYLCISTETPDVVVQCYKQLKLNEQQLDDVFEFFMDGLVDKDKNIHYRCALSIAKIALKLNERQLNK
ncbi:hypothetical protein RFI_36360, partial [Reticulomyxa filosa]